MGMTPSDVEQKTFSTALRGYDLDEVDDFLDEVISTIRGLQDQIADAKTANPVVHSIPAEDESAIGRVLMTAQATADTMIADAREQADTMIADAREQADQILTDARSEADSWADERDAKKAAADEEMDQLARHVAGVRNQLAVLATVVADRLDEMDEVVGVHDPTDQDLDLSDDADEESVDVTDADAIDDDSWDDRDDDTDDESDPGSVDDDEKEDEDNEPDDDSMSEFSSMEDE
jgi:cell division initiation protein